MCMIDTASTAILKLANTTGSTALGAANRAATPSQTPQISAQTQGGYQHPARNQLDRPSQVALNNYTQPPKDTFAQHEARQPQGRPLTTGLAAGENTGYAQSSGLPRNSPARRNEIAGAGAFTRPTPQMGEGKFTGPESSTGVLARTPDGNYSVYWPGLNNTQLKVISEEVRRKIAQSDTLKQQLRDHGEVEIVYGPTEGGTKYEFATNKLTIAAIKRDDARATTGSLAHESGHIAGPEIDASSVESYLNSEGAAQMNRIRVRNEILAKTGEDIGIGGSKTNRPMYLYIYNKYTLGHISYEKAIEMIGEIYGKKECPSFAPDLTYREYYERLVAG